MKIKDSIKQDVFNYWDEEACGTSFTHEEKYFEEIEAIKYNLEPFVMI